ncbi:hypothetical protein DMUE_3811 [Dictyocoela muelleri]|nr:hypothetical protein DMUE_3811 [Dictyocoela muelleri]
MNIDPPENVKLTPKEFLKNLKTSFKSEIEKQLKNDQYKKDPIKYKRLGLNEFLEKSELVTYHIFIPKEQTIKVIKIQNFLENEYKCQIRIDIFDLNVSILIIKGTKENICDLIEKLREIVEDLPDDLKNKGPIMYLSIPLNRLKSVIGVNGQTIEAIRKISNANIKFLEKDKEQVVAIIGDNHQKILALNMINKRISIPYGKIFMNVSEGVANYLKKRVESDVFSIYGSKLTYESDLNKRIDVFISRGDVERAQSFIVKKIRKCFKKNEYSIK